MGIDVTWERHGDIAIAVLRGRIDGSNSDEFQSKLEAGIDAGDSALVLDFGHVSYINSSGLRVGLIIAKQCRRAGRKFGICRLSDATRAIVAISGFDQVIPVLDSRNRALNQVSGD